MRNRRWWIVVLAASTVLTGAQGTASAASGYTVAHWDMDESSGTRTMYDSTGNGHNGRIGDEIQRGAGYYRFERLETDTPPVHPEHLAVVPDSSDLDPGTRDYAVTVRLRTREQFGNIVQKGQATVAGGSFKLQIPGGRVQCWFRGSAGQVLLTAPRPINDGNWHVVRCARLSDGVVLSIDGSRVAGAWGETGSIANTWPLSIGGKTGCDQISVGCDYYPGDIDYITLESEGRTW